jgi:ATP-dependent helicase HrpB
VVGADLAARLNWLQTNRRHDRRWQQLVQQRQALLGQLQRPLGGQGDHSEPTPGSADYCQAAADLVSWAYPERVALNRGDGSGRFLMRSGRGAQLPRHDPLAASAGLAVAAADAGLSDARIQLALPLTQDQLTALARCEGQQLPLVSWDPQAQRVRCERQLQLGALVLERVPIEDPDPEAVLAVLVAQIRSRGIDSLPWSPASRQVQQRLQLAHRHLGEPWPARSDEALLTDLDHWLAPLLIGVRSLDGLRRIDLTEALWADLPWQQRQQLEALLPETITVASGRRVRLDYTQGQPVLAVKLQELFGTQAHPTVLSGALRLRIALLSPAGRPAAISEDLAHFWQHTYPQVRRELRGRYPRHPWPSDPLTAVATPLSNRQLQQGRR